MARRLLSICLCLYFFGLLNFCCKPKGGDSPAVAGPAGHFTTVTLHPAGRKPVKVKAELAVTEPQRTRGLMYRGKLDPMTGMLFVFPTDQVQNFWMKNTFIPLDMIFMDARKTVLGVVHNARPHDRSLVGIGDRPSRYVLEVNGGFARKHGIRAGTRATFTLPAGKDPR